MNLRDLSHFEIRQSIATVLLATALRRDGNNIIFEDYAGLKISQRLQYFCSKLQYDVGHAAHVGWISTTLLNPIEVWDRIDQAGDIIPKRHYYSAYRDEKGSVLHYVTVAVALDGTFITAFQKDSARAIDERRNGISQYRCY